MIKKICGDHETPFSVVIPARFASTRLPGKPLADLQGKPMIVRVIEQVRASRARDIVVAVDDEKLSAAVASTKCKLLMTRNDHPSGSDRVMEVVEQMAWPDDHIVVNVQGDEPLIPPSVINQVADLLGKNLTLGVATLCHPIFDIAEMLDPNVVKVTLSQTGRALYFSRAPIPWQRGEFNKTAASEMRLEGHWFKHIGIYAYRVGVLRQFVQLKPSMLEVTESLEQLRLLENGFTIAIEPALEPVVGGVDTEADLERVRKLIQESGNLES